MCWPNRGAAKKRTQIYSKPLNYCNRSKGPGQEAKLCFVGHVLMENRHGLVVDAELTRASGHAERLAALAMLDRLGEDLGTLDRDIGVAVVDQPAVRRLLTITSMHVTVAAGWSPRSAISAVSPARRSWSATLASIHGSGRPGSASPNMAGSARSAGRMHGRYRSKRPGQPPMRRAPCMPSSCASVPGADTKSPPSRRQHRGVRPTRRCRRAYLKPPLASQYSGAAVSRARGELCRARGSCVWNMMTLTNSFSGVRGESCPPRASNRPRLMARRRIPLSNDRPAGARAPRS